MFVFIYIFYLSRKKKAAVKKWQNKEKHLISIISNVLKSNETFGVKTSWQLQFFSLSFLHLYTHKNIMVEIEN